MACSFKASEGRRLGSDGEVNAQMSFAGGWFCQTKRACPGASSAALLYTSRLRGCRDGPPLLL
eukprot:4491393-Pleurochrysis_carterae.AAC.1